jgi:hypothetical protein
VVCSGIKTQSAQQIMTATKVEEEAKLRRVYLSGWRYGDSLSSGTTSLGLLAHADPGDVLRYKVIRPAGLRKLLKTQGTRNDLASLTESDSRAVLWISTCGPGLFNTLDCSST